MDSINGNPTTQLVDHLLKTFGITEENTFLEMFGISST